MAKGRYIIVTGASGFVGSALCRSIVHSNYEVVGVSRRDPGITHERFRFFSIDLIKESIPDDVLRSADVVIHCAGRAHILNDEPGNALEMHRRVNTVVTQRLGAASAEAGVRRLVFLSSIGVYGGLFGGDQVLSEESQAAPLEPYAVSKLEAEYSLKKIEQKTGLEISIVRPCLVAGKGAPGNLERLSRLVRGGLPIPVPIKHNRRSFVGLDNLVELIKLCIDHEAAAGEVFIAADREIVSTREIMKAIAEGMGVTFRPVPLPDSALKVGSAVLGRSGLYEKIFGDLVASGDKAERTLGWKRVVETLQSMRMIGQ